MQQNAREHCPLLRVGSYGSKVGERVRPFLVTSVAVFVAMVKFVVRMVDFISVGRVRAKPYIGMTRLP